MKLTLILLIRVVLIDRRLSFKFISSFIIILTSLIAIIFGINSSILSQYENIRFGRSDYDFLDPRDVLRFPCDQLAYSEGLNYGNELEFSLFIETQEKYSFTFVVDLTAEISAREKSQDLYTLLLNSNKNYLKIDISELKKLGYPANLVIYMMNYLEQDVVSKSLDSRNANKIEISLFFICGNGDEMICHGIPPILLKNDEIQIQSYIPDLQRKVKVTGGSVNFLSVFEEIPIHDTLRKNIFTIVSDFDAPPTLDPEKLNLALNRFPPNAQFNLIDIGRFRTQVENSIDIDKPLFTGLALDSISQFNLLKPRAYSLDSDRIVLNNSENDLSEAVGRYFEKTFVDKIELEDLEQDIQKSLPMLKNIITPNQISLKRKNLFLLFPDPRANYRQSLNSKESSNYYFINNFGEYVFTLTSPGIKGVNSNNSLIISINDSTPTKILINSRYQATLKKGDRIKLSAFANSEIPLELDVFSEKDGQKLHYGIYFLDRMSTSSIKLHLSLTLMLFFMVFVGIGYLILVIPTKIHEKVYFPVLYFGRKIKMRINLIKFLILIVYLALIGGYLFINNVGSIVIYNFFDVPNIVVFYIFIPSFLILFILYCTDQWDCKDDVEQTPPTLIRYLWVREH